MYSYCNKKRDNTGCFPETGGRYVRSNFRRYHTLPGESGKTVFKYSDFSILDSIEEAPEEIKNFRLDPFEMKVQGLDRTFVDKVFAIRDYYMQDRVKKHSRHIYDIYKLLPVIP
ncbi:nucleotidyl transferase AbiEii/AbiGii toxin family protein [Blautia wexlerae]|uniref:nucleotidyl transferase AbiEii/AbiGii toxin family protein n=1 Tax=Blautia wexlerae TaxID=418240 RepID=UPI003B5080F4